MMPTQISLTHPISLFLHTISSLSKQILIPPRGDKIAELSQPADPQLTVELFLLKLEDYYGGRTGY